MNFPIIQQHDDLIQAVDAKELYEYLGLNMAHWSRWSLANIANNPFALEGTDYGVYTSMVNTVGGRPTTDYALSIDFAKKLSMQVKTEKGEQVRNYFLECERKLKVQIVTPAIPQSFAEALQLAADQAKQLELAAPKIAHYDKVVERDTLLNATTVAQSVGIKSANALNKMLEVMRVYNMTCKRGRVFQSWFMTKGYGEMKQGDTGHHQALFTTKGQAWIVEKLGGVK